MLISWACHLTEIQNTYYIFLHYNYGLKYVATFLSQNYEILIQMLHTHICHKILTMWPSHFCHKIMTICHKCYHHIFLTKFYHPKSWKGLVELIRKSMILWWICDSTNCHDFVMKMWLQHFHQKVTILWWKCRNT